MLVYALMSRTRYPENTLKVVLVVAAPDLGILAYMLQVWTSTRMRSSWGFEN